MQNDPKGGERRAKNKSFLCISFFKLTPSSKATIAEIKKVVLLACRSARKRNRIARSLGGEGNRIDHSFGQEGNKNIRRYRGKGI